VLCDVRDVGALIPQLSLLQFGVSSGARAMSGADDGTSAVGPSTSNREGCKRAKRKPMDEDRWVQSWCKLSRITFESFHSIVS
jgi:hypothetical protein